MTTFALAHFRPRLTSKLFWMRANRAVAWAMIVSPPLQWALGMRFATGLTIDLAMLLVHALMSFALFGKPETKARTFNAGMHVFGIRPAAMSERNRFMLTGYRIAMALLASVLLFTPLMPAFLVFVYPLLRLPVTVMQHIFGAVVYALKRWGMRDSAYDIAFIIVALYVLASIVNLFR